MARLLCGNPLPEGVNFNETMRGKCYSGVVQSQRTVLQRTGAKAGHTVRNNHRSDVSECAVADFYTAKVDTDLEINIYIFLIISVEQKYSQCRFRL